MGEKRKNFLSRFVKKESEAEPQSAPETTRSKKMIRRRDLFLNYYCFYLLSLAGYIPIEFSLRSGRIKIVSSGHRRWLWNFWFFNGILYSLYMAIRLIQSTAFHQVVAVHHLSYHIALTSFSIVMSIWQYILFIQSPDINETIFNMIEISDEENTTKRRSYTIQEWFIIMMPTSINFTCFFVGIGIYYIDWNSLQFLFCFLPAKYQNSKSFLFLLIYENLVTSYYYAMVYYGLFVQLAFIQNCNDGLKEQANNVRSKEYEGGNRKVIHKMCRESQRVELKIKLFNHIYAPCIFFFKLNIITIATALWYFFVRFLTDPFVAVPAAILVVNVTLVFIITYDKAFRIPGRMQAYKDEVLIASQSLSSQHQRDYVKRRILSVPDVGIRVGNFQNLERTSTPTFVDFTLKQVCGLLVAVGK